jgi:hypothetical protein
VIVVKDAEISLLKSRIEHLQATSAPALLDQTEKMSAAVDRYVGKVAKLEEDLKQASTTAAVAIEGAEIAGILGAAFESLIIMTEAVGYMEASRILAGELPGSEADRLNRGLSEVEAMVKIALEGKKPSFFHLKKRFQKRIESDNPDKT